MAFRNGVDFEARNQALLRIIANGNRLPTADGYEGLRKILDVRRVRLRMTMEELDARTSLPHGYCAKLFCGTRNFGPKSLDLVLRALGAKIAILPARAGKGNYPGINRICDGQLDKQRRKAIARLGWDTKMTKMTPTERSEFCRKGALARAKKHNLKKEIAAKATIRKVANGQRQQTDTSASTG